MLYIQLYGGASKIGCIICYNFGKDNQELSFIPGQLPLLTNSCPVLFCILSTFQPFSPSEIYFTDAILISTDICGRAMPGFLIFALHIYVHIQPQRHCYQSALIFYKSIVSFTNPGAFGSEAGKLSKKVYI